VQQSGFLESCVSRSVEETTKEKIPKQMQIVWRFGFCQKHPESGWAWWEFIIFLLATNLKFSFPLPSLP